MTTIFIITLSLFVIVQAIYIQALQRSPMGVLTPTALRIRLAIYSFLRIKCFVIGLDIRKMKSMNTVLGYTPSNKLIGRFIANTRRYSDIVGQYGGDEFVICGRGDANALVKRLLAKRDEINAMEITQQERNELVKHTDGLIDGLHVAICMVKETRDAFTAAQQAIDATEPLKAGGRETGDRNTSGKIGTLLVEL